MNQEMLQTLGITADDLIERIVSRAVDELLNPRAYNDDSISDDMARKVLALVQSAVDAKVSEVARDHLIPRIGELIEKATLTETNRFGEPKNEPMSFVEYLANCAERYMTEDVNSEGLNRSEGDYRWSKVGPRITVLMKLRIKEALEEHTKRALKDVNAELAKAMQKAAADAISSAASAIKVSISQ